MSPQNESNNGHADPADEWVGDDVWLYRLVPTYFCERGEDGWEIGSAAFSNSTEPGFEEEMSVVLGDTLIWLDRLPEDLPTFTFPADAEHEQWGVAKLLTETVRTSIRDQEIVRSPTDDEPAHGDVCGPKNPKRRKRFKKNASWVIEPAAPSRADDT